MNKDQWNEVEDYLDDVKCGAPHRPITGKPEIKRYVKLCPYRRQDLPQFCNSISDNFICGSITCWELGEALEGFNFDESNEKQFRDFARSLSPDKKFYLDELIERYCKAKGNDLY